MSDTREFRVLKRSTAMLLIASVLAAAAVLVWACMLWIDSYGDRMVILNAMSPEQAAAELASDLRTFAVVLFALMLALSGFLVWYGLRILRSRSLPPAGTWIIEGQHIRRGREAATAAWVLLVFAGLVALFAFVTAALVWSLAATV